MSLVLNPTEVTVAENGDTDTYQVRLSTEPTENVTVTVRSGDTDAATVIPEELTFTAENWNRLDAVITVTGVDDDVDNFGGGRSVRILHTATGGGYDTSASVSVTVTNEGDTAGLTLALPSDLMIEETDDPETTNSDEVENQLRYTVVLDSEPTGPVTVTVVSGDTSIATVTPTLLRFTSSDYAEAQTVTVTSKDDDVANAGRRSVTITHKANGGGYDRVKEEVVVVTVTDDDTAGLKFTPATPVSVREGGTKSYQVELTSQPTGDVTVTLNSTDPRIATVKPTELTFTSGNWDQKQGVTVTGGQNDVVGSTLGADITHTTQGGDYDGVAQVRVAVTVTDDDKKGITVTPSSVTVHEDGGEATYGIKLNSEPTGNVTVTVTSDVSGRRNGVSGPTLDNSSQLTFNQHNWNMAQTVTVTGVDDAVDNTGDQRTVSITHTPIGGGYIAADAEALEVFVTDDDTAGVTITPLSVTVAEDGGTATYTVVLNSRPTQTVTIARELDPADSPPIGAVQSLSFIPSNWNQVQTVTVTGQIDNVDNAGGSRSVMIRHTPSGGDYAGIPASSVGVTVTDDDTAELTVTPELVTVSENRGTTSYRVVLKAMPSGAVTVTVTSRDMAAAVVHDNRAELFPRDAVPCCVTRDLTFTTDNWDRSQTVYVGGVDDDVDNAGGSRSVIIINRASGGGVTGTVEASVRVTVNDHGDTARVIVAPTSVRVAEIDDPTTATYMVKLNSEPTGTVTVYLVSGNEEVATVNPAMLMFDASNYETERPVTVTGVNDDVDNRGTRSVVITHTPSGGGYDGVAPASVRVTVTDDDTAGLTFGSTPVEVSGPGVTAPYTVALKTKPTDNVTLSLTSSDTSVATVDPPSLIFTPANYDQMQGVTVTGVNTGRATIRHAATGGGYSVRENVDVTVAAVAGLRVDPLEVTVVEGATANYTVALNTEPDSNVVVALASSNQNYATVSPLSLTFTPANYGSPQTVTVTGEDDSAVSLRMATITNAPSGGGAEYAKVQPVSVTVTVTDNDAGLTISDTQISVAEARGTKSYSISLRARPTGPVTVTVASSDSSVATVIPATLRFTPDDWSVPRTVAVTGVPDDVDNAGGSRTATVSHTSRGGGYDGVALPSVQVTVTDDEGLVLSEPEVTVPEAGGSDTYTVTLDTPPTGTNTVTVVVVSRDTRIARVSPRTLSFTAANWNRPQTVTVTGVNDDVDNPGEQRSVSIAHTLSGEGYGAGEVAVVLVTVTDDDIAGLTVSEQTVTVGEAGGTATYTVELETQPTSTVTVAVATANASIARARPATLSFTAANWNRPQTVTVTGENDNLDNAGDERSVTITHTPRGGGYGAGEAETVQVTVTDDDTVGLTVAPSTLTVSEAGGTGTYTVELDTRPTSTVTVAVASTDTRIVTVAPTILRFTVANWNTPQAVTVTGENDDLDNAGDERSVTITHAPRGGGYGTGEAVAAQVTVADDDDAGLTVTPGTVTVAEAGGTATYTVELDTEPTGTVTVAVASADTRIVTVSPATLRFTAANWNSAQAVAVTGVNDDVDNTDDERSAMVTHTPSGGGYGAGEAASLEVSVTDDDAAPAGIVLTVDPSSVNESAIAGSRVAVTATVAGTTRYADAKTVMVTVGAGDDSATQGEDYREVADFTVTIAAGASSGTEAFTLTSMDDSVDEADEIITVAGTLQEVTVTGTAVTLLDDDPAPTLSITGSSVDEGATGATPTLTFTVTKTGATSREVTVAYAVTAGTATSGIDYEALNAGTLTFAPAETAKTIDVTVRGDDADEYDETIEVTLSSPLNATLAAADTATGTIIDDDAEPTLSISGASVTEGAAGATATLVFTVTKTGLTNRALRVAYAITGGSATSGSDYEALDAGTITLSATEASKAINITVLGDDTDEYDETIEVTLSSPLNATLDVATATGTIVDDDAEPTLSINGPSVSEGAAGTTATLTFTVTKTGATSKEVTVGYADAGSGSATSGTDYEALDAGTITLSATEASKAINITVLGDDTDEYDETIEVTLSGPLNATLDVATATGTIIDDDAEPTLSINGPSVAEGTAGTTTTLTFTVTKTGATSKEVTVGYADAGSGSATSGSDYEALRAGTLTFAAAETAKPINVTVKGDDTHEQDETVKVTLSNPSNATIMAGKSTGTGTITDDDADKARREVATDWLARFGRTAAGATVDAIARRMNDAPSAVGESSLTLAGRRVTLGGPAPELPALSMAASTEPWEDGTARSLTIQELADSAFDLERSFAEGSLNVWGAGAYSRFEKTPQGEYEMDGNLMSGLLGVDHAGDNHVAGLALAYHGGDGTFSGMGTGAASSGDLAGSLFSVHPYVRVMFGDLFHLGGSFGFGTGDMRLEDAGGTVLETSIGMPILAALDARLVLSLTEDWALAVQADAHTVRMVSDETNGLPSLETDTNSLRLGLETSYAFMVAEGVSLAPVLETGLRLDGGHAETGIGLDAGGALRLEATAIGLMVDARGHAALGNWSDDDEGDDAAFTIRDWGVGGVIRWRLDLDGMGPEMSLAPSYGVAPGDLANGGATPRLDAEIGYRLAAFGGVLTPYSAAEFSGNGRPSFRVGAHLELAHGMALSAEGTHRQPSNGAAKQSLTLELRLHQ